MAGNIAFVIAACLLSMALVCHGMPTNLDPQDQLDDFDTYVYNAAATDVDEGDDTFSFASYYGDSMVLQQAPARAVIWGHAPTSGLGQTVTVSAGSLGTVTTTISAGPVPDTAVWRAKLPPVSDHGPFFITVTWGNQKLTLSDVLFGDVWVCSGQSNMQFSMIQVFNATRELSEVADYPDIRVFTAALRYSAKPLYELISVEEKWSVPSEATIGNNKPFSYFSAVCWLYGKYLYQTLGYPIGLVDTDWGGTRVEAWSSPDALAKCGLRDTLMYKPRHRPLTRLHGQDDPSQLWNAMVHPLLNMTIYGAIWYQGEANTQYHTNLYNCTFPAMISDWRQKFNEGSLGETNTMFPFGFVQLACNRNDSSIVTGFPDIRWHQTADYGYVPNPKMPNTFMAVAMDLPDFTSPYGGVHPRDKEDVCQRLALSGLSVAYNRPGIKFQGPLITSFNIDLGNKLLLMGYDNGTSPIEIHNIYGFEVCCGSNAGCTASDPGWKAAPIRHWDDNTVKVSYSLCGSQPVTGLRYEWRESPCPFKMCSVYSQENLLPAPPFIINGGHIGTHIKTWQDIQAALQKNKY